MLGHLVLRPENVFDVIPPVLTVLHCPALMSTPMPNPVSAKVPIWVSLSLQAVIPPPPKHQTKHADALQYLLQPEISLKVPNLDTDQVTPKPNPVAAPKHVVANQ